MNGIKQYSTIEVKTMDQVSLESRALIRTASALNEVKEHWETKRGDLPEALEKNRKLWTIIASAMQEEDCPQPKEVRTNITNLALFVFKKTMEVLANPDPNGLGILININMNIAKGLTEHADASEETPQENAPIEP